MANQKSQALYMKLYWIFTALMLLTAMPLGIVLILIKLFEQRGKRRIQTVFRPAPDAPVGARTTLDTHPRPARECLEEGRGKMRRRAGLGLLLSILCVGLLVVCAMNDISLWTISWCLFCSLFYFYTGLRALRSLSRFRDYLSVMEKKPVMTVAELARQTGLSEQKLRDDWSRVEFMDLIPGIFLDRNQDILFCC